MRRLLTPILLLLMLAGCIPQPQPETGNIPHERYTEAAGTVAVQLTKNFLLTPSVTPTFTPEPTGTATLTPEPSPTLPSPTATYAYHMRGAVDAPILVYYTIADDAADTANFNAEAADQLSSAALQAHLAILREKGYDTITVETLINTLIFGGELPEKPLVITFDSTAAGIYTRAFPALQAAGYTGNVYVTVADIGQTGMLTADQLKELLAAGWSVGSHGMYGRDLTADHNTIGEELSTSRVRLEEMLGAPVTIFSYPFGRTDDVILSRIGQWGYTGALGLHWYDTTEHSVDYLFYLSRIEVENNESGQAAVENLR
jgi:peptidoglycan/xylan/chitin deacetylase (PgdA/CDA1 family)